MRGPSRSQQLFEEMSIAQRRFLLEKDFSGEKTISEWVPFLQPIVAYDILIDESTRRLQMALRFLLFMALFNLVVAFVVGNLWVGLLGGAMLLLAFFQWVKRKGNDKRDLDNHLRSYFFPLLRTLDGEGKGSIIADLSFHLRQKDNAPVIISAKLEGECEVLVALGREGFKVSSGEYVLEEKLRQPTEFTQAVMTQIARVDAA